MYVPGREGWKITPKLLRRIKHVSIITEEVSCVLEYHTYIHTSYIDINTYIQTYIHTYFVGQFRFYGVRSVDRCEGGGVWNWDIITAWYWYIYVCMYVWRRSSYGPQWKTLGLQDRGMWDSDNVQRWIPIPHSYIHIHIQTIIRTHYLLQVSEDNWSDFSS